MLPGKTQAQQNPAACGGVTGCSETNGCERDVC